MIIDTLTARLDGIQYPIVIGSGLEGVADRIESFTDSKHVFLLSDSFFKHTYCAQLETDLRDRGFEVVLFFMEGGRASKTIYSALALLDTLETNEFTRDSTLVAVGGGIVGDVGGFAAATFLRGMNLVHIPTTVTAQIDSSLGGKVAVNHNQTINAIGTYYHPRCIFIDMDFLRDLPEREFKSGMGEVTKSALIRDDSFCEFLIESADRIRSRDLALMSEMVKRTVRIKLDHVEEDVREKGIRLHLNYGHTIGQSIEMSTGTGMETFRHGEAVCLGMMAAAHLADSYYDDGLDRLGFHRELLSAYDLPCRIEPKRTGMAPATLKALIFRNVRKDKKRVAAGVRFVLVTRRGSAEIVTGVGRERIQAAIDSLIP